MRWSWLLLLLACGRNDGTPSSPQHPIAAGELHAPTDSGEVSYRRYCIGCHGADGKGNGGTTGADLTAAESPLRTKTDDELLISVRDGKTGKVASMPAHKPVLSEAQIRQILAFAHKQFAP